MRHSSKPALLIVTTLFLAIGLAPPGLAIDEDAVFSDDLRTADEFIVTDEYPPPSMDNDASNVAGTGSIALSWHSGRAEEQTAAHQFEIHESLDSTFNESSLYYRGPDLATYVSGLASGTYYYRVREWLDTATVTRWSKPVEVIVEHHSLETAWFLFAVGGVVFLLTTGVVVYGAREQDGIDLPSTRERGN